MVEQIPSFEVSSPAREKGVTRAGEIERVNAMNRDTAMSHL
jgi:hypothetical protein